MAEKKVLPLLGNGKARRWRLDMNKYFAFAKSGTFPLDEVRGEVVSCNGATN